MSQSFLTLKKTLFSNHLKYELFSFYYQSIYLGRLYRYQYLVEFRYFFTSKTISHLSLPAHHIALFTKKIVIFYTEIFTGKVVLWCFFSSETREEIHNSTFQVKISVQNVIFSNEMEKKQKYFTYFSMEFEKKSFYYIPQYIYSILQIYQWECSAEAVTPELVRQFFKIFPTGKTICNFYGSTEMSDVTYATFGSLEDFESKLDSNRQIDSTPSVFTYAHQARLK